MKMATQRAGKSNVVLAQQLFMDAGIDAVMTAVKNFNPDKKRRLITYTSVIVRNSFNTYMKICNAKVIALPVNGPRTSGGKPPNEQMRKDAERATNIESLNVRIGSDSEYEMTDSHEYAHDVEDKPKEKRFGYHADEFWKILRNPVFGLTAEEVGVIEYLCIPKKVYNANKKLAKYEGIAKMKNILKDVFAREETVNVPSFLEKIGCLEKAG